MDKAAFFEIEFYSLILFSIILPVGIYAYLMGKKSISLRVVLMFGLMLILLSGIDVYLLQRLAAIAKASASLLDDAIFASEISLALYLIPVLFAGIGVNMVSQVLISHLLDAEKRYDGEQR
ncbi:MAG: hypothetical protein D4S02_02510 [Rhodocyclaceae bacterium]|nr:MAG: hypothetical protein D4S02_02510 [Rhodocyclaceae bacterium]